MEIPEESRLYLENARRDLRAAESNLQTGYYHITISRSYYAMFYAANALLSSKGIVRSRHSGVISAFGEYFVKTGLIEADFLQMLCHAFDSRLDSDYDLSFVADRSEAEDILVNAHRFVERVERYFGEQRSGKAI